MFNVYFIRDGYRGTHALRRFCPGGKGEWKNIKSVDEMDDADVLVICGTPFMGFDFASFSPEKIMYYKLEPDEFWFVPFYWKYVNPSSHMITMDAHPRFATWDIKKTYDELLNNDFPEKTKRLSWVTTNYGDGTQEPDIQVLSGHRLRMKFLKDFLKKYPDEMILYGRRLENYKYKCNKGALYDKWEGLADYRYTFSFMNSSQIGFFDEKLVDAIMAGCMPMVWGCPNLEDFLPKNSFIRLDITKDDAIDEAVEIANSDFREQNLDELKEAKRILLTELSLMPQLWKDINERMD